MDKERVRQPLGLLVLFSMLFARVKPKQLLLHLRLTRVSNVSHLAAGKGKAPRRQSCRFVKQVARPVLVVGERLRPPGSAHGLRLGR